MKKFLTLIVILSVGFINAQVGDIVYSGKFIVTKQNTTNVYHFYFNKKKPQFYSIVSFESEQQFQETLKTAIELQNQKRPGLSATISGTTEKYNIYRNRWNTYFNVRPDYKVEVDMTSIEVNKQRIENRLESLQSRSSIYYPSIYIPRVYIPRYYSRTYIPRYRYYSRF